MGGMRAMQKIFKDRIMEKPVQGDILQESFINTMPAWINMLLLSASGPIKPVVAACATAAQSVEVGVETILSGKAKVVLCGGCDDFQEEGSFEFATMRATSDSLLELAAGREPREMCRPAADTRAGFMEAQGAGNHVLMTAAMAIKMGLPIRGIVAHTSTAMDKLGRSVPAPGQGILTTARETPLKHGSPLLDLEYRSAQLRRERQRLKEWVADEYKDLAAQIDRMKNAGKGEVDSEFVSERTAFIEKEAARREQAAKATWSHDWWKNDPSISPIRGALATYGLTIDDIGVASFHGTGTKANDFNESSVLNEQMKHLGRKTGNLLPAVFQKHLTGHPKGAAGEFAQIFLNGSFPECECGDGSSSLSAAWMLNGVLQVLETGLIPGNRNLDNADHELRDFKYILYPSHSIQTDGVRAGLLKSFGFGQAGAEVLVVHPDFLFAALEEDMFRDYVARREKRQRQTYRYYHEMFTGQKPFVRVKSAAPYTPKQQNGVYLNLLARASYDKDAESWSFANQEKTAKMTPADVTVTNALTEASKRLDVDADGRGIGIDVQLCSEVPIDNQTFVERNFTKAEQAYCRQSADPLASFSGKWAAKEAVIKAVTSAAGRKVWTGGAGAPLKEIEILRETGQAPVVRFYGAAEGAVKNLSIQTVKGAISHSGAYSVSVATVVS
ncbi:MAG: LOW QUALITY PROTEIN: fatty acid synthase alpha subunit reductase [Olpidium bornovanus]|uniref:Fatty acid synthase alpha subunit reductase n=1 Tax=Olpidium bornovanus TaxID=278681 RepID=A0A8H8DMD8_9FUNG|nr:MAG: LOW QUALITY PROTEIN: fatty acid synthase alpha subunit reductase [Olpidium bornovanus]